MVSVIGLALARVRANEISKAISPCDDLNRFVSQVVLIGVGRLIRLHFSSARTKVSHVSQVCVPVRTHFLGGAGRGGHGPGPYCDGLSSRWGSAEGFHL